MRGIATLIATIGLVGCAADGSPSSESAGQSGSEDATGSGSSSASASGSASGSASASASTTSPGTGTESSGSSATTAVDSSESGRPPRGATEENLKVALFGDQGTGSDPKAVYQLALDEGADFIIILGDFDYADDPDLWASEMAEVLGDTYPVFGVVGNHDIVAWSGYHEQLQARLAAIPEAECTGELGTMSTCKYRGLHFVTSGIGMVGVDREHEAYIEQSLQADDSIWSLCIWHANQTDMQAGDKSDEIGWNAFRICQDNGALIVMGHEHSYARTLTLTDVGNEPNGHGAIGDAEQIDVALGSTFSVVNGLGGASIRDYSASLHDDDTWWATLYTATYYMKNGVDVASFEANYGALFIEFYVDGDPTKANAYFKNISGDVIDEFTIVRN
jgi:predicted phosphodiesterase